MAGYELAEAAMLIMFSISWYWSIARMLRVRVASGKSATFVFFICTGYVFGIAAKLGLWAETAVLSPLVWLYAWNLAVTLFDLFLVLHFGRRERNASVQGQLTPSPPSLQPARISG